MPPRASETCPAPGTSHARSRPRYGTSRLFCIFTHPQLDWWPLECPARCSVLRGSGDRQPPTLWAAQPRGKRPGIGEQREGEEPRPGGVGRARGVAVRCGCSGGPFQWRATGALVTGGARGRGFQQATAAAPRPRGRRMLRALRAEPGPALERVMGRGSGPSGPPGCTCSDNTREGP